VIHFCFSPSCNIKLSSVQGFSQALQLGKLALCINRRRNEIVNSADKGFFLLRRRFRNFTPELFDVLSVVCVRKLSTQ
jgi:hypothetical protein